MTRSTATAIPTILASLLLITAGCGDGEASIEPSNETDNLDTGTGSIDSETATDADAGADTDADTDSGSDSDSGTGWVAEFPFTFSFDENADDFETMLGDGEFTHNAASGVMELDYAFVGPEEQVALGRDFWGADWRGAEAIDFVVRTLEHTTGHWLIWFFYTYSWVRCELTADHPTSTEWTTITLDLEETCEIQLEELEMCQRIVIGVVSGADAAAGETVQVAIDSITVR